MKTLKQPEFVLTLIILVGYFLCTFFCDHIFSYAYTHTSNNFVRYISAYKTVFFIASVFITIFYSVKFYRSKILTVHKQYRYLFEANPMPMTIVDPGTQKFVAANKAALDFYGYSHNEFWH